MAAHSYNIPVAFSYEWTTPEGTVSGAFESGPTGPVSDEQAVAYLDAVAVPNGFAEPDPVDDAPDAPDAPDPVDPQPDPNADPTPQEQPQ